MGSCTGKIASSLGGENSSKTPTKPLKSSIPVAEKPKKSGFFFLYIPCRLAPVQIAVARVGHHRAGRGVFSSDHHGAKADQSLFCGNLAMFLPIRAALPYASLCAAPFLSLSISTKEHHIATNLGFMLFAELVFLWRFGVVTLKRWREVSRIPTGTPLRRMS